MLSITEVVNSVQKIGASLSFIANSYVSGIGWGNGSRNIFDSHCKDENLTL